MGPNLEQMPPKKSRAESKDELPSGLMSCVWMDILTRSAEIGL
jgi:hypothetical protein